MTSLLDTTRASKTVFQFYHIGEASNTEALSQIILHFSK